MYYNFLASNCSLQGECVMPNHGMSKALKDFRENSFMIRVVAQTDAVSTCKNIRDLLVKIHHIFVSVNVAEAENALLQETVSCTEQIFAGENRDDFFDLFYRLGVVLISMGEEELGITCQYLHHNFQNRPRSSWPPLEAYAKGCGSSLRELLPIIEPLSSSFNWEMETLVDLETIPR